MMNTLHIVIGSLAVVGVLTSPGGAEIVEVDLIAYEGLAAPGGDGGVITSVNPPFTNALGQVGFTGNLDTADPYVWFDDQIIWRNSMAKGHTLTGTEGTSGISDAGGFIYSPQTDGEDSVWTQAGLLLRADDPVPSLPDTYSSFNSRPRMLPDGTAYWISGLTDAPGGSSQGRALISADPTNPAGATVELKTGDDIDGFLVSSTGIGFAYDVSPNGSLITDLAVSNAPTDSDEFVYVNGVLEVREGDDAGDGTAWTSFDMVAINDEGNYLFAGATTGPAETSEYLAYNGEIALRRGDVVGGVLLEDNWACQAFSINNLNQVVHIWKGGFGSTADGALFVGSATDLQNSTPLLRVGDEIDTTGNGVGNYVIDAFAASAIIAPGLDLSDDAWVYVHVDTTSLDSIESPRMVIRVPFKPAPPTCDGDLNGDTVVNVSDLLLLLGAWGPCPGCDGDLNGDDVVNVSDLLLLLGNWGNCG